VLCHTPNILLEDISNAHPPCIVWGALRYNNINKAYTCNEHSVDPENTDRNSIIKNIPCWRICTSGHKDFYTFRTLQKRVSPQSSHSDLLQLWRLPLLSSLFVHSFPREMNFNHKTSYTIIYLCPFLTAFSFGTFIFPLPSSPLFHGCLLLFTGLGGFLSA
jgi:hypothetical protein